MGNLADCRILDKSLGHGAEWELLFPAILEGHRRAWIRKLIIGGEGGGGRIGEDGWWFQPGQVFVTKKRMVDTPPDAATIGGGLDDKMIGG